MEKLNIKETFYIDSASWRVPAILAIIFLSISMWFKHHLYYIYYYLFFASIVSFFISFRKYAVLTEHTLVLFFPSIFSGKKMTLQLDKIESICPGVKEIESFVSIGIFGGTRVKYEIDYIQIKLTNPLSEDLGRSLFGMHKEKSYNKKVELTNNGLGIKMYQAPKGGFRYFLNKLAGAIHVLNEDAIEFESKYDDLRYALFWISPLLGLILIFFLMVYQSIR